MKEYTPRVRNVIAQPFIKDSHIKEVLEMASSLSCMTTRYVPSVDSILIFLNEEEIVSLSRYEVLVWDGVELSTMIYGDFYDNYVKV